MSEKKSLVIIGSGGHAGCLRDIARLAGIQVMGFVDRTRPAGTPVLDLSILGGDELLQDESFIARHLFAIGIGHPLARRRYGEWLQKQGAELPAIINPSSFVSPHAELGQGVLLMGMNAVNHGACIGDFAALDWQVTVGHGADLGKALFAGPGSRVAGDVVCGSETYLGLGCQVIEKVQIGKGCLIGAGATVIRDLPDHVLAVGSPARVIRENPPESDLQYGPSV
ncbi:MAG: NeuD/PglB/VioB family sugar acetyltransferase [Candidatus Thiodiazotropha sp.]